MNRSGVRLRSSSGDLAGECLCDGGGLPVEATQDIDEAVCRDGFKRRRRREQDRIGHGWRLRPGQQGGRKCGEELAVQSAEARAHPTLDAVNVGVQLGKGDGCRLVIAGIAVEIVNRRLDRRRNRLPGRAGEHEPVMMAGQGVVETAIVLCVERRKPVGRIAEDDVEADRLHSGLGQPVDKLGPERAEKDARGGCELFRV